MTALDATKLAELKRLAVIASALDMDAHMREVRLERLARVCSPDVVLGLLDMVTGLNVACRMSADASAVALARVTELEAERSKQSQRADVAQSDCGELKDALGEVCWAPIRPTVEKAQRVVARLAELETALTKISAIRDSIVGMQGFNFSEHAYPLVAALDEAGYKGAGYEISRANLGTLIEQIRAAEARVAYLEADRGKVEQLASDQRDLILELRKERDEIEARLAALSSLNDELQKDNAEAHEREYQSNKRNEELELRLLAYWVAYGAVADIQEPRVVAAVHGKGRAEALAQAADWLRSIGLVDAATRLPGHIAERRDLAGKDGEG